MNKSKANTNQMIKKSKSYSAQILISLATSSLLLGCATPEHRTKQTLSIVKKEVVLIERLKAERSSEAVVSAVQSNATLTQAEEHLLSALEELLRANQAIQSQILTRSKESLKHEED